MLRALYSYSHTEGDSTRSRTHAVVLTQVWNAVRNASSKASRPRKQRLTNNEQENFSLTCDAQFLHTKVPICW